ncbi:carboxypeptidase-like regulatory domain-containing protein [Mariniflexile sp. HMF6888]|uniref:carboxypeptidase-like regulatory domain-containing protein n=1 Tax=Mariniflexile sp. HMF6888 TaxID=3373086 RepID=UPI00378CECE1
MYFTNNAYGNRLGFIPFDLSTPPFSPDGGTILLKGRVIDFETNKPLPGAHVYYIRNGEKKGSTTNWNGEYELQTLPTDLITISFIGYKAVEAKASDIQKIEYLDPQYEELKDVVVTAPKKTKNNTILYVGVGLFALVVIAVASKKKSEDNQTNEEQ